jgi:hypothetical protein
VHLEQRVLPAVPIRHWIGSLLWGLRALLCYDRVLCVEVVGVAGELGIIGSDADGVDLDLDRAFQRVIVDEATVPVKEPNPPSCLPVTFEPTKVIFESLRREFVGLARRLAELGFGFVFGRVAVSPTPPREHKKRRAMDEALRVLASELSDALVIGVVYNPRAHSVIGAS